MNLETIAMSRRMVEEKGLEMLTNIIHADKPPKAIDILNIIRLFWPQERRIKPVWIPGMRFGKTPADINEEIRRIFTATDLYTKINLREGDYGNTNTGYIKLVYANYPSGKSYLAGISFIQVFRKDAFTLDVAGILVDAGVFYFSEPLEVSIDIDKLKDLGDPDFMSKSKHFIETVVGNDHAHRQDATQELEFMTTHYDVLKG